MTSTEKDTPVKTRDRSGGLHLSLFPEWALPSALYIHERDILARRAVCGMNMKKPLSDGEEHD